MSDQRYQVVFHADETIVDNGLLVTDEELGNVKVTKTYAESFENYFPILQRNFQIKGSSEIQFNNESDAICKNYPEFRKWYKLMKRDFTDYMYGFESPMSKEMYSRLKSVNFSCIQFKSEGKKALYGAMQMLTFCHRNREDDPLNHPTHGDSLKKQLYTLKKQKPSVGSKKLRQFEAMNVPIHHIVSFNMRGNSINEKRVEEACCIVEQSQEKVKTNEEISSAPSSTNGRMTEDGNNQSHVDASSFVVQKDFQDQV